MNINKDKYIFIISLLLFSLSSISAERSEILEMELGVHKLISDLYASSADKRAVLNPEFKMLDEKLAIISAGINVTTKKALIDSWSVFKRRIISSPNEKFTNMSSLKAIEAAKADFVIKLEHLSSMGGSPDQQAIDEAYFLQSILATKLISLYSQLSLAYLKLTDVQWQQLMDLKTEYATGLEALESLHPNDPNIKKTVLIWKFVSPIININETDTLAPYIVHKYGNDMISNLMMQFSDKQS